MKHNCHYVYAMPPTGLRRAPRQQRSQDTLDRLVTSAERALERDGFDGIRLQDVARAAGVTVGAFYARFSSKDALLRHLEAGVRHELAAAMDTACDGSDDRAIGELAFGVFRSLARVYERHRGVVRAVTMRAQSDAATRRRRFAANQAVIERFVGTVYARRAEIGHPRPADAIRLAMLFVGASLRELLVFREFSPGPPPPVEPIVKELTAAFLAYLEVKRA
jgi:AcrR family transcriptional regulator